MRWLAACLLGGAVLFAAGCASSGGAMNQPPVGSNLSVGGPSPSSSANPSPAPSAAPSASPARSPSPSPSPTSSAASVLPSIAGCQIFPANNPWNTDISNAPVDPNSANYLSHMNAFTKNLHPDFGSNPTYGIPYITVPGTQPRVPMSFTYASESDPGPYPFPANAPVEGGPGATGDRHVLVVDRDNCVLYETFSSLYVGPGWTAGSGAVFHFNTNALRPDYWTSADAAGLPIFPGLVRLYEAQQGAILHALRFTVHKTQKGFIHPATHFASSSTDPNDPPMGLRLRLKASYDISHFTGASKVILVALKRYGLIVADNGSDWFISGETNANWNDNDLNQLKTVPASQFEVVQSGPIIH